MNNNRVIYTIALVALCSVSGYAAEVNKEVKVTRAYVPEIKMATKLHLTPDTSDDSVIEPDIDYSITPISIETILESELYKPVKISLEEYEPTKRFYTKIGMGAPLQSVADLYVTPTRSSSGYVMGYFNQMGRYAEIENDYGNKEDAVQNHLRGGVAAGKYINRRTLEGRINYDNDLWSRYATNNISDTNPLYQSVDMKGRFGDDFSDLSRFNFSVEALAEQFWSRSDYENFDFGASALAGGAMLGGEVVAGVGYENISGNDDYLNSTYDASLCYIYSKDLFTLKLGLQYYYDRVSYNSYSASAVARANGSVGNTDDSNNNSYITPDIEIEYHLKQDRVVGYVKSSGELQHRNYATLSEENPYLAAGLFAAESGVVYDVNFGLKGRFKSGVFGYNIFAEYYTNKNNIYWALVEESNNSYLDNYFVANYSTQHNIDLNVELEYKPLSNLIVGADMRLSCYTDNGSQKFEDGGATIELNLDARYDVGSWSFGLSGELVSSRMYSVYRGSILHSEELPTSFDLGLSAEYKLRGSMRIFIEGENLLNSDIYRWVGYREYGINAMAGIRMQF